MLCRTEGGGQPFQYQKEGDQEGLRTGTPGQHEKYGPSGRKDAHPGLLHAGADQPCAPPSLYRHKRDPLPRGPAGQGGDRAGRGRIRAASAGGGDCRKEGGQIRCPFLFAYGDYRRRRDPGTQSGCPSALPAAGHRGPWRGRSRALRRM